MKKIDVENDRLERQKKTAGLHLAMEMEAVLGRMRDLPGRARRLDWFEERLLAAHGTNLGDGGKRPLIGTLCVQVPDEIIHAAGGFPVRLCSGAYALDQAGAELLPAKSCPLTRATIGRLQLGGDELKKTLAALVIPTTCDHKRKLADIAEEMGFRVLRLAMPATKEGDLSREYWQESVSEFAREVSGITGRRLTAGRLQDAIASHLEAGRLFRRLQEHRQAADRSGIYGVDLFCILSAFSVSDPNDWCAAVHALLLELDASQNKGRPMNAKRAPRILFTGSPAVFPNLKVPLLIEEMGGRIVADESCAASRLLADLPAFDEALLHDMLPALADRALKPCTCPCLSPNHDRQRAIARYAKDTHADGIVSLTLSGCLPYEMEQRSVTATGREAGLPVLALETDYSPEDSGQLATRIEAFLESIQNRRRKLAA